MKMVLYLAFTLISNVKISNDLKFKAKKLIYQLIKLNPSSMYDSIYVGSEDKKGYTLLHMACDRLHQVKSYSYVIAYNLFLPYYPNYTLVHLLLECGIEVDVLDHHKNTPLHILVKRCYDRMNSGLEIDDNVEDTCKLLLMNGAHVDIPNNEGKTPIDYGVFLDLLLPHQSLQCLGCTCDQVKWCAIQKYYSTFRRVCR